MKKKESMLIVLFILLAGVFSESKAQFTGKVAYGFYQLNDANTLEREGEVQLTISPNRMSLNTSEVEINSGAMLANQKPNAIIVRSDKKDFIIETDEPYALKVSMTELTGMMNMMKSFSGSSRNPSPEPIKPIIKKTTEKKTFQGIEATKYEILTPDEPETVLLAWMATGKKVNWGMMTDSFGLDKILPLTQGIFSEQFLPLQIDQIKNGVLTNRIECTSIEEVAISDAQLDVSSGTTLMSIQQLIMQQMMNGN